MAVQKRWNDDSGDQMNKLSGWMAEMNPQLRRRIRAAAAKKDIPVQKYIEDVLEQAVPQEQEEESATQSEQHTYRPVSKEALEGLIQLREQIKQNHPGQTFDDSTEIVRQMREERSQYLSEL